LQVGGGCEGHYLPESRTEGGAEPADTWLWLATAQEIAGQWQAEVGTLQRGLALRPADVDLLYLLGSAYERLGKQRWHTSKGWSWFFEE